MASPPVYCPQCGHVFLSTSISFSGAKDLVIRGSVETCELCGGDAEILDGLYNVFDDVVIVRSLFDRDPAVLVRAGEVARLAARGEITANEAIKRGSRIAPEIGRLFRKASALIDGAAIRLATWATIATFLGCQPSPDAIQDGFGAFTEAFVSHHQEIAASRDDSVPRPRPRPYANAAKQPGDDQPSSDANRHARRRAEALKRRRR